MMANSIFNLSDINGTNGFAINGINVGDRSGNSVSSAGDINGDGRSWRRDYWGISCRLRAELRGVWQRWSICNSNWCADDDIRFCIASIVFPKHGVPSLKFHVSSLEHGTDTNSAWRCGYSARTNRQVRQVRQEIKRFGAASQRNSIT